MDGMAGLLLLAALIPIALLVWLIWFLQPGPSSLKEEPRETELEESKQKSPLVKVGTFILAVLVMSVAKAACHREQPPPRVQSEAEKAPRSEANRSRYHRQ